MLVLTRKVNEGIHIGDNIYLRVVEVGRGAVRIGIEAPGHVSIHRQEIYEKIQEQNLQASRGGAMGILEAAKLFRHKDKKESEH